MKSRVCFAAFVLAGYAATVGGLGAYAVWVVRRARALDLAHEELAPPGQEHGGTRRQRGRLEGRMEAADAEHEVGVVGQAEATTRTLLRSPGSG